MQGMELFGQPVMLPADDPNSPYYYNPNPADTEGAHPEMTFVREDKGEYSGEVDAEGRRIGVGTAKWGGGAYYTGDWVQNVRHGNGMFMNENGDKYEG